MDAPSPDGADLSAVTTLDRKGRKDLANSAKDSLP
jgi:hypothetical protein